MTSWIKDQAITNQWRNVQYLNPGKPVGSMVSFTKTENRIPYNRTAVPNVQAPWESPLAIPCNEGEERGKAGEGDKEKHVH